MTTYLWIGLRTPDEFGVFFTRTYGNGEAADDVAYGRMGGDFGEDRRARSNRTETNCYRRFWHPPTEFQFRRVNDPSLRIGSPSAGLSMRCSSCHSKCQSAPCASATQGTTRIKPPPGVPWDAGGGAKAEALTLPHLETNFWDAQAIDFAGGIFVPFLTLYRITAEMT